MEDGKKEATMSKSKSIAERRAAWRGLERPRVTTTTTTTARFRTNGNGNGNGLSSPPTAMRSPCLVIPPGLSPAALLDSPVLLLQVPLDSPADHAVSLIGSWSHQNLPEPSSNLDSVQPEPEPEPSLEKIDEESCDKPSEKEKEKEKEKHQSTSTLTSTNNSLEDGYNWRKYGQKHVKGCEFPRNYYKCTYPNCNVKKMVEQSAHGQITDLVYKGNHDHPLPQPGASKTCNQKTYIGKRGADSTINYFEVTSSASVITEISDHMSVTGTGKESSTLGLGDSVSCGNLDDVLMQRNVMCDNDNDNDKDEDAQRELKRRKNEDYLIDALPASHAAREPRVVVQTISEIDLLDDGYRWRKYGQKIVKGNPNPRSYYKCTSPGCPVRKHVERAPHDLKSVITTYEGKHNHEVPVSNINNSSNFKGPGDSDPHANTASTQMTMQPQSVTNLLEPIQDSFSHAIGEACMGTSNLNTLQNMPFESYLELLRQLNPDGLAKYTGN